MDIAVRGLAPYLPGPGRDPRWWIASGRLVAGRLEIDEVREQADAPEPATGACVCGLAAPCSLPGAFLEHLGVAGERDRTLRALAGRSTKRLLSEVRAFARRRPPGQRHPLRAPQETTSALARHRLPLFKAALPLLSATPTLPWVPPEPPYLVEVDLPRFLHGLGLPSTRLAGTRPQAVQARARILEGLAAGTGGIAVEIAQRDEALASFPALASVVAAAAAAWVQSHPPAPTPEPTAAAWFPCPAK